MKTYQNQIPRSACILLLTVALLLEILLSPKWSWGIAAWILPVIWVYLGRNMRIWPFLGSAIVVKYLAGLISFQDVFPFPGGVLFVYSIFTALLGVIPYLADRWTVNRLPAWLQSLLLPSLLVLIEWGLSNSPSGTWGSIAYTQYGFAILLHLTTLTGIWGIVFLVYWTGTIVNHWYARRSFSWLQGAFCLLLGTTLAFGVFRENVSPPEGNYLWVGSVTANQLPMAEAMYEAMYQEKIVIPARISQADPLMARIGPAFLEYLENPSNESYRVVRTAMDSSRKELYRKSEELARQGAQVIVWSEGAVQEIKPREKSLISEAGSFSRRYSVWFILPVAVSHPGSHGPGDKFLENKLLIFNPEGEWVGEYYKNVPVEGIEPSVSGDGRIPVYSMYGARVSPIICYDADFPRLVSQTGRNQTDVLLVPSSDWSAISRIHAEMARIRSIENGSALYRPAGNGRTLVTDSFGRTLLDTDYFYDPVHTSLVRLPVAGQKTLYSQAPGTMIILAGLVILFAAGFGIVILVQRGRSIRSGSHYSP